MYGFQNVPKHIANYLISLIQLTQRKSLSWEAIAVQLGKKFLNFYNVKVQDSIFLDMTTCRLD